MIGLGFLVVVAISVFVFCNWTNGTNLIFSFLTPLIGVIGIGLVWLIYHYQWQPEWQWAKSMTGAVILTIILGGVSGVGWIINFSANMFDSSNNGHVPE